LLYITIPKGFLPLQDTGLITAVTEAGTDVSFAEMQRRQRVVEDAIRSDPDVTGVVSVIGVSPINATPNAGRLAITLKPRDDRKAHVDEIVARLKQTVARRRATQSEVIREALEAHLAGPSAGSYLELVGDLAGSLRGGPADLSSNKSRLRGFGR